MDFSTKIEVFLSIRINYQYSHLLEAVDARIFCSLDHKGWFCTFVIQFRGWAGTGLQA